MNLTELGMELCVKKRCPGHSYRLGQVTRVLGCYGHSECTGTQVLRRNSRDGQLFWGCSRWPDCSASEPFSICLDLKQRLKKALFERT